MIEISLLEAFAILFGLAIQAGGFGIAYQKLRSRDDRLGDQLARQQKVLVLGIRLVARRNSDIDREWLESELATLLETA